MLSEHSLKPIASEPPANVIQFAVEGLKIAKKIDCFDYVPSDARHVWQVLSSLKPGRICEWGSGIGIATGIAKMLGFSATGIEINEELVVASREFLLSRDLDCQIHHGSYFDIQVDADYYFVYCWPGKQNEVEKNFSENTPPTAQLLVCHGAEDIRLKTKSEDSAWQ